MRLLPAIAFVALASIAGGCGSSTVNPVAVLKKIESCSLEPGSASGQKDAYGSTYAACTFSGGASVTATAIDIEQARKKGYEDAQASDDAHKIVSGKGFYLVVTADPSDFDSGAVNVSSIAKQVGGKVRQ